MALPQNAAQAKRIAWTERVWDLIRAKRYSEARDMMNEAQSLGRSRGWQGAWAWFEAHDKATPFTEDGDAWIALQGMIWFSREV